MSDRTLGAIGLRAGETIRFKRIAGRRWERGSVRRVETDGSITLIDSDGASRSYRADDVEVRRPGRGGRLTWQRVAAVAVTWEQLELFPSDQNSSDHGSSSIGRR